MRSAPDQAQAALTPKALQALREKVRAQKGNRVARFDLVRGLVRSGKLKEALKEAKAWREKDAYNLVVVRLIGDIYTELGQLKQAARAYSAVVELLPEDPAAHRSLATVLKANRDFKGAYDRLKVAAKLRKADMRIAFELADVTHRLNRTDEAITRFQAIIAAPKTPGAVRYPAKQRLAQLYAAKRRAALAAGKRATADRLSKELDALKLQGGAKNDIKIYLSWDTDRSDVDLWVITPKGEKIYYGHKRGRHGGALFGDVTTGYGPESFTAKHALSGAYQIKVHYYSTSRRRFTEARGEVVVILHEGTAREKRHILPYRLFKARQQVHVGKIAVRPVGADS